VVRIEKFLLKENVPRGTSASYRAGATPSSDFRGLVLFD
jgi:hypothetical protein